MSDKYVFTLDENVKQFAEKNLKETDESRDAALEEIKRWLIEEGPHLHARLEDKYILPFLRGCKFNTEKTKAKLTNYYTMRRDQPEQFSNRDPLLTEIQELVKLGVFVPLRRTVENRLVIIIRTAVHDPKKHKQDDVFKAGKMILDVAALEDELVQIYGITAIFDMTGVGLWHAKMLTPNIVKKTVFSWQNYHCRPRQLEFINAPLYINVVLRVFKSFMTEKMRNRVRVHFGGVESLHEVVDRDVLPPEYGGNGESMESLVKYWSEKLLSNREWFAEDEQYKAE
ncbi:hypothetical protein NQ314_004293 [Rhamnusium bicolor]|uniref:CRAL-TRIO domain-containing protein n=1 Tax=Rhamnusium bicolor TaxID=1586634 RepID=A0AAV8ZKC1_9CUCU|nr:hypothetical protein NQ314_004293 [Rhamnusium bicolor]